VTEPEGTDGGPVVDAAGPEQGAETEQTGSPEELLKEAQRTAVNERRLRNRMERELTALKAAALTDSEKAVEEAKASGRKEGARTAGTKLAAAEFRARAAEAKLPSIAALLEVVDLAKFVDDDGEPDDDAIQAVVDKLAEGLAAVSNGTSKPRAPDIPKGIAPKAVDDDWLRSMMKQS
jgi:hypothetical protein